MARSRERRRLSSCSGVGGTTISQTRGSPRFQASNVLSSVWPSIMSVFARRRRLDTAIEAGSTTWLLMSFASSNRCTQKPSRPASWMTTTLSDPPTSCSALPRRRASKASNFGAPPAAIMCFDILSLFGDSEVTSQLDRLNSSDTYSVERSPWLRAKFWLRVLSVGRIGFLLAMQSMTPHPTKAKTQAGGVGAPWNLYHSWFLGLPRAYS